MQSVALALIEAVQVGHPGLSRNQIAQAFGVQPQRLHAALTKDNPKLSSVLLWVVNWNRDPGRGTLSLDIRIDREGMLLEAELTPATRAA